ncbi:helix-turn-helix domain-containing protein [Nocardiopsis codii]|uniref:helix-turn-helix domain-containing protein n=1 Tax=Nocardiopsis codii TaxID=3065942 RepID=UPI0038B39FA9
MDEELLDDAQVAQMLGASQRWVADQARQGVFPHYRFGRSRRYGREHVEVIKRLSEQPALAGSATSRPRPRPVGRGGPVEGRRLVAKTPRRLQQVRGGEQ